jgi:hypothetical protein
MGIQVTVTLSDELYRSVEQVAEMMGRPFEAILIAAIENDLPVREIAALPPVTSLTDDEVLEFANLQMEKSQDKRLSFLLNRQQETKLTEGERIELRALMQIYQVGLLRKAQAQVEGFSRGIYSPPES